MDPKKKSTAQPGLDLFTYWTKTLSESPPTQPKKTTEPAESKEGEEKKKRQEELERVRQEAEEKRKEAELRQKDEERQQEELKAKLEKQKRKQEEATQQRKQLGLQKAQKEQEKKQQEEQKPKVEEEQKKPQQEEPQSKQQTEEEKKQQVLNLNEPNRSAEEKQQIRNSGMIESTDVSESENSITCTSDEDYSSDEEETQTKKTVSFAALEENVAKQLNSLKNMKQMEEEDYESEDNANKPKLPLEEYVKQIMEEKKSLQEKLDEEIKRRKQLEDECRKFFNEFEEISLEFEKKLENLQDRLKEQESNFEKERERNRKELQSLRALLNQKNGPPPSANTATEQSQNEARPTSSVTSNETQVDKKTDEVKEVAESTSTVAVEKAVTSGTETGATEKPAEATQSEAREEKEKPSEIDTGKAAPETTDKSEDEEEEEEKEEEGDESSSQEEQSAAEEKPKAKEQLKESKSDTEEKDTDESSSAEESSSGSASDAQTKKNEKAKDAVVNETESPRAMKMRSKTLGSELDAPNVHRRTPSLTDKSQNWMSLLKTLSQVDEAFEEKKRKREEERREKERLAALTESSEASEEEEKRNAKNETTSTASSVSSSSTVAADKEDKKQEEKKPKEEDQKDAPSPQLSRHTNTTPKSPEKESTVRQMASLLHQIKRKSGSFTMEAEDALSLKKLGISGSSTLSKGLVGKLFKSKGDEDSKSTDTGTSSPKANNKESAVFGIPIENLVLDSTTEVPLFVAKAVNFLRETLHTAPAAATPNSLAKFSMDEDIEEKKQRDKNLLREREKIEDKNVKSLRDAIQTGLGKLEFGLGARRERVERSESFTDYVFTEESVNTLLRNFFEELPAPLLSENNSNMDIYNNLCFWTNSLCTPEEEATKGDEYKEHRMMALRSILFCLPHINRKVLFFMLHFFNSVIKSTANDEDRREEEEKIVTEWGPLFLRPPPPIPTPPPPPTSPPPVHATSPTSPMLSVPQSVTSPSPSSTLITSTPKAKDAPAKLLRFLLQNYEAVTQKEPETKYAIYSGRRLLSAASVKKLILKTLDPFYPEKEYVDIVQVTHAYYISSEELLQRVINIYTNESFQPNTPWNIAVRLKVLENLRTWIKNYSMDLKRNKKFVELCKIFGNKQNFNFPISKDETSLFSFLKIVMGVMEEHAPDKMRNMRRKRSQRAISSLKIEVVDLQILDVDPTSIAEQLSLIHHDLFKAITPSELIQKNFENPKLSPHFSAMVANFNDTTAWVAAEVLREQKAPTRGEVITHFIKIARVCRECSNFHCSYAIIAGLNNAAISRLKLSWEKVPRKYMMKYHELCKLFDMSLNFKEYREALASATPPIVPYLALYPKDLTSVEESPTIIEDKLVNVEKMRMVGKIVLQTREYQGRGYPFHVIPELATYLKHFRSLSKEEAFKTSLLLEPRDPKTKKNLNLL